MGQIDKVYVNGRGKAARGGQAQAFYDLGLLYSTGNGVEADYVMAHKYFNLAAMHGLRQARIDRAELALDMSDYEISEAQRRAREWRRSEAD